MTSGSIPDNPTQTVRATWEEKPLKAPDECRRKHHTRIQRRRGAQLHCSPDPSPQERLGKGPEPLHLGPQSVERVAVHCCDGRMVPDELDGLVELRVVAADHRLHLLQAALKHLLAHAGPLPSSYNTNNNRFIPLRTLLPSDALSLSSLSLSLSLSRLSHSLSRI